jgi:hypothetical protein
MRYKKALDGFSAFLYFWEKLLSMTTITLDKPLTNLQVELLKLFSRDLPEKNLLAIKELISDYLLDAARDEADKVWDEKGYDEETVQQWLHKNGNS